MQIEQLAIAGAYLVTPTLHRDHRGEFGEVFVAPALSPTLAGGLPISQVNTSWSRRGTLRGLHVSTAVQGQAKLVLCPSGAVLDIIVDARHESPTFGQHAVCTLDSQARACLLIPPGVAHSFLALTDATVTYACSTVHDPDREISIDAVVAGSLLRVLNEMAVIGGRSAVSLMLRALLRDIDRGGGQSSFLSVYDGATELVDQAIASQPGCPE